MSEYKNFIRRTGRIVKDEIHHKKIKFAINNYITQVDQQKNYQFKDWLKARVIAKKVKEYCVENLSDLLVTFEKKITARGVKVLWATDAEEARGYLKEIFKLHEVKKVVKSKSMTTEEIDFNLLCKDQCIEVWESDLGEFIVQLADEKPYHIVTPAMHKTKSEISELFRLKLNSEETESAEELTMIARKHLRDIYTTADLGVTGANFLIAEEGAVILMENEGNGRLTVSCPPVHVVIAGIEKIIPRLSDLAFFLPLLATSGTGQQITCYNSVILGPKQEAEADGPRYMYVILLDNGRSELYKQTEFRSILRCIRCGACLNACPVYQIIGGHSYNSTYQGPIGSVITPHFAGLNRWNHLAYASTLCGACSDVCPVDIEIHRLLLENRWFANRLHCTSLFWGIALKIWAFIAGSRRRMNLVSKIARQVAGILVYLLPKGKRIRIPKMPEKSFGQLWQDRPFKLEERDE
jgi:L-lactate dehydrogenase complex protein LldF